MARYNLVFDSREYKDTVSGWVEIMRKNYGEDAAAEFSSKISDANSTDEAIQILAKFIVNHTRGLKWE